MPNDQPMFDATHIAQLQTAGFVRLAGFSQNNLAELRSHFEIVAKAWGKPAGASRWCVQEIARKHAYFDELLREHLVPVADTLLGAGNQFVGGDLSLFSGDTKWHIDSWQCLELIKLAIYLDDHGHDSGALRVFVGSHKLDFPWQRVLSELEESAEHFGFSEEQAPAWTIQVHPGDLVAFNPRLIHSAWGAKPRRQIAFRFAARPKNDAERAELKQLILAEKNLA
jgi:hypothetical protein